MVAQPARHQEIRERILSAIRSVGGGKNECDAAMVATRDISQWSGSQHVEWLTDGKTMRVSWSMYHGGLRDITIMKTESVNGVVVVTEQRFQKSKNV